MVEHTHWADITVNVRVYFTDDQESALMDQAVEAMEEHFHVREVEGEIEDNGLCVLRVDRVMKTRVRRRK